MKRLLSVFLFLFCCVIAADAQDDAAQYDSIMNLMKNKKIPLMERYYMTGDIEYLSREHQIAVLKQLIPEAEMVMLCARIHFVQLRIAKVKRLHKPWTSST